MFNKNFFEGFMAKILFFVMTNTYFHWMLASVVCYFILAFLFSKLYKGSSDKIKSTMVNLKVVLISAEIALLLAIFGVHKAWIVSIVGGISFLLLSYTFLSYIVFNRYATRKNIPNIVKDEELIQKFEDKDSDEEFSFNGQKYKKMGGKLYQLFIKTKPNKTTSLYDMFFILGLSFIALFGLSLLLDNVVIKDSVSSYLLLGFGASFVVPFLQDIKHTVRFARNPYLNFDGYVGFWINGKEVFGKIVDMTTFEIILYRTYSKSYETFSHSEIKTFTTYTEGRLFSKKYIVSKDIKYKLEESFKVWLDEFNKSFTFLHPETKIQEGALNLDTYNVFFTTEDDDHGIELNVFVRKEVLEQYKYYVKKLEDFIQRKADENDWSLETPKRIDLKLIKSDNLDYVIK